MVDFTWVLHALIDLAMGSLLALCFEADRIAKFAAVVAGGRDALLGRLGPRA